MCACVYKYTQKYIYTHIYYILYTCVYMCVYIYTCLNVYTHMYLKCVYVYLLKKQIPYSSLKKYSENIKMILAEEKGQ